MDHLLERIETLERQAYRVEQQLHWWRGLACTLIVVALVNWTLPSSTAQEDKQRGEKDLVQRVAALEKLLKHFSREKNEVFITGANLHIVNGLGRTECEDEQDNPIPDCPNGLGNLIVGYNELRPSGQEDIRTGSHNLVLGKTNNFSGVGGVVAGEFNTISGRFASVYGGLINTADGGSVVIAGGQNSASSGSVVIAGFTNTANGEFSVVNGGYRNTASGIYSSVSGGANNMANGAISSVSGGGSDDDFEGATGNTASGSLSSVSGGNRNTASGRTSSVSGGNNRKAEGEFDWVAGNLFEDD